MIGWHVALVDTQPLTLTTLIFTILFNLLIKEYNTVKWTTLDPCLGLSDLKLHISFEICEEKIHRLFKDYRSTNPSKL